jgi:hypothetical protein
MICYSKRTILSLRKNLLDYILSNAYNIYDASSALNLLEKFYAIFTPILLYHPNKRETHLIWINFLIFYFLFSTILL